MAVLFWSFDRPGLALIGVFPTVAECFFTYFDAGRYLCPFVVIPVYQINDFIDNVFWETLRNDVVRGIILFQV